MPNLGGGEVLMILLVALIVLGPTKLPTAVRQVGRVVGEIRRVGAGFQQELRDAAEPVTETVATIRAAGPDVAVSDAARKPPSSAAAGTAGDDADEAETQADAGEPDDSVGARGAGA